MQHVVKVTCYGRISIPKEFRKKHDISEGYSLLMEGRDEKIIINRIERLEDLEGVDSTYGTRQQLKVEADKLRNEYQ